MLLGKPCVLIGTSVAQQQKLAGFFLTKLLDCFCLAHTVKWHFTYYSFLPQAWNSKNKKQRLNFGWVGFFQGSDGTIGTLGFPGPIGLPGPKGKKSFTVYMVFHYTQS